MKTILQQVNVFDVSDFETNEELKKKVLTNYQDINLPGDWYEPYYKEIKEQLVPYGYSDMDLRFTGFYSQGDGASITGKIDARKWLYKMEETKDSHYFKYRRIHTLMKSDKIHDFIGEIKRDKFPRYSHEMTTSLYFTFYVETANNVQVDYPNIKSLLDELVSDIHNHHVMCNKNAYTQLMKGHEDLTEDSCVIDTLRFNEYHFTEDGKIFNPAVCDIVGIHVDIAKEGISILDSLISDCNGVLNGDYLELNSKEKIKINSIINSINKVKNILK